MDLTWAGEELRDSVELARRRLDAVIAACRPAQRPGSLDEQEQLSRVLLELVATIRTGDPTIVAEIAAILADSPWAPEGAFVSLARIEGPVASIEGGSAAVRREIARCGALPGVVVRRLAGDRDGAVVVALLANASNTLAEDLIDTLVDRAVREPALRSSLARRAELGPAQAGRLARSLSSRERTRLARRFGSALAASPPTRSIAPTKSNGCVKLTIAVSSGPPRSCGCFAAAGPAGCTRA